MKQFLSICAVCFRYLLFLQKTSQYKLNLLPHGPIPIHTLQYISDILSCYTFRPVEKSVGFRRVIMLRNTVSVTLYPSCNKWQFQPLIGIHSATWYCYSHTRQPSCYVWLYQPHSMVLCHPCWETILLCVTVSVTLNDTVSSVIGNHPATFDCVSHTLCYCVIRAR